MDELDGTYNKLSLPEDFPKLVEEAWDFIRFYGLGEFFDEDAYSRKKRRKSDLIFCKVYFRMRRRSTPISPMKMSL